MNLLVLGGSRFVGRHITDACIAGGHRVTHFNRGVTSTAPRADIETIHGDRNTDLQRLASRSWDAVIDTSGYTPDALEKSTRYLASRTARYVFISTISVYDFAAKAALPVDEDFPLLAFPADADRTRKDDELYGALKVLCEAVVRSSLRHRATIVRPGLVAGPYDPTDRFTYWPVRVDAGGSVLAPDAPSQPIQYIDARDLAQFVVHLIEIGDGGTYNAVTSPGTLTFGNLLDACLESSRSDASIIWAPQQALKECGVAPWGELPLWIPRDDPYFALADASNSRARVRGLRNRPIFYTVRDTLAWARSAGKRLGSLKAGLTPAREAEVLRDAITA